MKKEEVNKQIKEVVRPNGKGEINGNNLQETLLLINNNAANDEDTTSKLNLKANQKETDEKLALKADKTSVYTKEEANALLDLKVNIKDYEADKEVSSKEKQELDVKLAQTKQELDSVKNSLSHMGNGVVGEAKGGSVVSLPNNAMSSVAPNYKIEGLTVQNLVKNGDFSDGTRNWIVAGIEIIKIEKGVITFKKKTSYLAQNLFKTTGEAIFYSSAYVKSNSNTTRLSMNTGNVAKHSGSGVFERLSILERAPEERSITFSINTDDLNDEITMQGGGCTYNLTQMFGAGNEPSKEWCDAHLPDYVEGTKSVQLPMRVKSVGENLWNTPNVKEENKHLGEVYAGDLMIHTTSGVDVNVDVYVSPYTIKVNFNEGSLVRFIIKDLLPNTKYFISGEIDWDGEEGLYRNILSQDSYIYKGDKGRRLSQNYISDEKGNISSKLIHRNKDINNFKIRNITLTKTESKFIPYQESLAYFNDEVELKSVGKVKDYIENGELYKNISNDGEILEKTEVVNLSTSGLIEANPNGTIFFEPITNLTGFYDNGLDVEGLDILEVEEFSHLINGVYQSLDVSKVKVEGGKLTHPDAKNGIVYLVYRYDDNAVWGENTISYYNSDKTLKSPNGKIWKKVESATDTGELVVTLEEVK